MPGEHVDEAALAVFIEGHLWPREPAEADEPCDEILDKDRVPAVDEAIEVASPRPGTMIERHLERPSDRGEGPERDRTEMPSLDPRHGRLGYSGKARHVDLAKVLPNSDRSKDGSEAKHIHG